jgi:hypothetical protein
MAEKNPLDEIVEELVVFKHEDPNHHDGHYFSNSPMWHDSRIRARWMELYSDESLAIARAKVEVDDEDIEDVEGDDYETWTNDELRGELAKRELSVEGKKADLVARLREDDDKE